MTDAFLKAFKPSAALKLELFDKGLRTTVLFDVQKILKQKYETFLDAEQGVLYLGRKKK